MSSRIALLIALLACSMCADSALAASRVSGRLSNASYDLVLLARSGRAQSIQPKANGRFSVRVSSAKGASLHLVRRGRYAGPVVLRGKKPRVALAGARRVNLGTVRVRVRARYATTSRRVAGSGPPIRTAGGGRPLGAGKLGLVHVRRARADASQAVVRGQRAQTGAPATEGADVDLDGIPNAFDADDDGDLTLDNIEGAEPKGPRLSLSSALPLDITETINANAGADTDQEATIRRSLRLLYSVSADELGGAQRIGVSCVFAWCAGAQVVIPPGLGDSTTAWSDGDADGLLDLAARGPAFQQQIYPRASTADIKPGDTFTATSDQGATAAAALAFYFTSSVAVQTMGSHTFSYPAGPGSPGSPGNPISIPRTVRITLWRPQRAAIPGAESGTLMDIGGLRYGVDVSGAFCRAEDFSGLSETLTPGVGGEAPLQDTAADARPSGATLSFTVDTAACGVRGGGDAGGGLPMVSIVAQDAAGDLTRQHLVVQFE
jgi:hypothetical protein